MVEVCALSAAGRLLAICAVPLQQVCSIRLYRTLCVPPPGQRDAPRRTPASPLRKNSSRLDLLGVRGVHLAFASYQVRGQPFAER